MIKPEDLTIGAVCEYKPLREFETKGIYIIVKQHSENYVVIYSVVSKKTNIYPVILFKNDKWNLLF